MAGSLTISTLKDSSGVLATQNGMTGIAKAWGGYTFAGSGTTPTLRNSFNISSMTMTSTGVYAVAFTTAMPSSTSYAVVQSANYSGANEPMFTDVYSRTASGFTLSTSFNTGAYSYGFDFVVIGS